MARAKTSPRFHREQFFPSQGRIFLEPAIFILFGFSQAPQRLRGVQGVSSNPTRASMPIGARARAQAKVIKWSGCQANVKWGRSLPVPCPRTGLALQSSHTRCEWYHRVGRLLPYLHPEPPLRPAHELAKRGERSAKIG